MSKTYLNDALKARAAAQVKKDETGEVALDDVSRVKVLSPGRQVFKRFIRNRLAVFGSVLLITMFVFSFIGPLFYAYGQKQIFYKYDEQNINYAMAKENTAYTGYVVDQEISIPTAVNTAMNSNIKKMVAAEENQMLVYGEDAIYQIDKLADEVYQLSVMEADPVCTVGKTEVEIGTFSLLGKELQFKGEEVEGLADAAAKNITGKSGEFTFDGVKYSYKSGAAKKYNIYAEFDGIHYLGEAQAEEFEAELNKAVEAEAESFTFEGESYLLKKNGESTMVYLTGALSPAKVFTRFTFDSIETGASVSDEFRVASLLAASGSGKFSADGNDYTLEKADSAWIVRDSAGSEVAELSTFTVRRYSGEDSIEYRLKKYVAEHVAEMEATGQKSSSFTYELPEQGESGEYVYNEDGTLRYRESEMTISQRDTGEYVINADQIIYVIDRFATPSMQHVLGTDGDGFDVLSRIMYGGRVSLMVGFVVVFLECFLGIIMGGLAGYYGGWVDMVIMRLVDIFYCLPSMPIMIILGAMMDAMRMDTYVRLMIMMAALGIMGWAGVARMVRGQILSLREQEFMVATEATGIKVRDRIFHHLVPNVMPQLIVIATMGMGGVIITESTLSYLGLGVKHPLATWGTIINSVSSASAMAHYAHIWIPVGLLICLTVIAFNFVGDGLRDAYDPKAKR